MSDRKEQSNEVTKAFRTAIEDRAAWFYLLLKAAKEEGADPEKVAYKAISAFGKAKGAAFGEIKGADEFIDKLSEGYGRAAFDMETVLHTPEKAALHFHHCALVEAWKKLGLSKDEISELCRLACYGDLGVVSNFPDLKLEFPKLIAKGDDYCELLVTKDR